MLLLRAMTFGKTWPCARARVALGRVVFVASVSILGLLSAGAGCGGSTDPRPPKWSYISAAITEPSCATANCHSAIAARASVDLSSREVGYKILSERQFVITKAAAPTLSDDERVARSPVPTLMRAIGNLRMPPDLPVPEPDIVLIENWIRAGANDD
jgi:hypothetical protein